VRVRCAAACFDACPVHIDIPSQLIRLRRQLVERRITSVWERMIVRAWAWSLARPWRYRFAATLQRAVLDTLRRGRRPRPALADSCAGAAGRVD